MVRLSGADAWKIGANATASPRSFLNYAPRSANLVRILTNKGELIDQAVATLWRAPASYTGDDLVEFSCHGGREILRSTLARSLELGARAAEPGEFTQRAFLNGKMSLDQAEAVAALIEAQTRTAGLAAARLLDGELKHPLDSIRQELIELVSRIEISLDFIEDDLDEEIAKINLKQIDKLHKSIDDLIDQYNLGKLLRKGAQVVIAGPPNVGKSTLLNRFLGFERAIVSETPGTTRDYLEATLDWNGIPIKIFDTAGIRETEETLEIEGVRRSKELLNKADIIIWLISPPDFEKPPKFLKNDKRVLLVQNKCDLWQPSYNERINASVEFKISALSGEGVTSLRNFILDHFHKGYRAEEIILLEERHVELLHRALNSLNSAADNLARGTGFELIAADLRMALNRIGEITGAVTSQDILSGIFSRFCIGK